MKSLCFRGIFGGTAVACSSLDAHIRAAAKRSRRRALGRTSGIAGEWLCFCRATSPSRSVHRSSLPGRRRGPRRPGHEGIAIMKLVIIGGTGLIGSKLVTKLREGGHNTVAAAPNTGVNTLTGEGLAAALQGASVVVDVSNSPSFE